MVKTRIKANHIVGAAAKSVGKTANVAARATIKAVGATASVIGHAAKVSGEVCAAAMFCNEAEKALSLGAHDVVRDAQLAREEEREQGDLRQGPSPHEGYSIPDADIIRLFKATATAVWKLKGRMIDVASGEPKDVRIIDNVTDAQIGDFSKLWRHVEAIGDALSEIGVETIDWTGRPYDDGMSLNVIAWEKDANIRRATITETLLPTIRFKRGDGVYQIQQGEVVVSDPAGEAHGDA